MKRTKKRAALQRSIRTQAHLFHLRRKSNEGTQLATDVARRLEAGAGVIAKR